jgi:predicted unusual protein kinase regulating ubiquinone biosynthesis (AarF/ABC1/UbiB family)
MDRVKTQSIFVLAILSAHLLAQSQWATAAEFPSDMGPPSAWEELSRVMAETGAEMRAKKAREKAEREAAEEILRLKRKLAPLQQMAADIISVYAAEEKDQLGLLRRVLAHSTVAINELAATGIPPTDVLNEKLWTKFPETDPATRNLVNQTAELIKSDAFRSQLKNLSPAAIQQIPAEKLEKMLALGREHLAKVKISQHPGFKRLLDPKNGLKIEDESLRQMAHVLMPRFFDNLGPGLKAQIASGVLRLPPEATVAEQVSAALQNAGPMTQKLFQLVGEKTDSKELGEIMALLKENIQPIEQQKILETINARFGAEKAKELFSNISGPKNSGSVGQVHFATHNKSQEKIIIKVRRPGVMNNYNLEAEAMRVAAEGTGLESVAEKAISNIGKELDLRIEAENIAEGELYVDPKKGLGIARRIDDIPAAEDVLTLHIAKGASVKSFTEPADLVKRGQAAEMLLGEWVKHAVFKDGFFHGDLHTGNVFMNTKVDNKQGFEVTLIDFGNTGRISRQEQRGFVQLLSALTFRSPEETVDALARIGTVPDATRGALLEDIRQLLKDEPTMPIHKWFSGVMEGIAKAALKHKVDFPESFIAFQRGKTFLENEIDRVNELLDKADPAKQLPRFDPTWTEVRALLEETHQNAAARVFRRPATDSLVTWKLLRDVTKGWRTSPYRAAVKDVCRRFYESLNQLPY